MYAISSHGKRPRDRIHPTERDVCATRVRELINLQREGSNAKVYQVRQVRQVILRYGLEGEKG
jgi:hypothetical protein